MLFETLIVGFLLSAAIGSTIASALTYTPDDFEFLRVDGNDIDIDQ